MTLTFHDQKPDKPTTTAPDAPERLGSSPSRPGPVASRPDLSITPVVAGLMAVLGGAAALVGAAGSADLHPGPIIVVALAIVVGGFVVRSLRGGGRGLIPVSMLMLVVVALAATASPYL
ncbi:MAG: hypothetical protein ACN4IE_17090, partial [Ilumatobacter sp.]